jgi:DNA-directed RNA polymerase subunit RPC12/RpoP
VEESLIKKLVASVKCGVCGQRYELGNINILGHRQDLWYMGARCSACHTRSLVAVVVKEDRVREVITDLADTELDKFKDMGVLTADDVLDMHNFLKEFSGDFSQLLNRA